MEIDMRVYDAENGCAVYQNLETGVLQLVGLKNTVVASASPNRPANYNRIVGKILSYSHSYIKGTRDTIVEKDVEIPQLITNTSTMNLF